jgi:hypothetical protein
MGDPPSDQLGFRPGHRIPGLQEPGRRHSAARRWPGGAQFESAIILSSLTKNLRVETKRVLPVVLPGRSPADIPVYLSAYSTSWFDVPEFTDEGVSRLLAVITGHGQHPMPERGEWRGEATPEPRRVLLANGLPWLARSSDVRPASAWIDGVQYDDSIVLRPATFTAEARGFIEVDLAGAYQWMTSVAGVLDDAAESFQVGRFQVCLDGNPQSENRAAHGKPARVKVDVTGARRLRLEMYRPGTMASPLLSGESAARSRLPELAWGNPTLF